METQEILRRVLEKTPGSARELSRAAGISHTLLLKIRNGERRLTPETREALIRTLRDWSERCGSLADALAESEGEGSHE